MENTLRKGFTLKDFIIAVAVIALLTAFAIIISANVTEYSNKKSALSDAKNAVQIYTSYCSDDGSVSVADDEMIIEVKKADKDWYLISYNNSLYEKDDSSVVPYIPDDCLVYVSQDSSEYENIVNKHTADNVIRIADFPDNVIIFRITENEQTETEDSKQTDTEEPDDTVTIADIIATYDNFPTSEDDGWKEINGEDDEPVYLDEDGKLHICNVMYADDVSLWCEDGNYVHYEGGMSSVETITFVMESGRLTAIIYEVYGNVAEEVTVHCEYAPEN